MARQTISVGSAANDGTGDTLRQAAQKINETFLEIYQKFGDSDNLSQIVSFVSSGIEFNLGTSYTLTALAPPSVDRTILLDDASGTITINEAQQTLLQKTLTAPTITLPKIGTGIQDSNGNELIDITAAASAVNQFTLTNSATGNAPTLGVAGGDSNINLNLISKGVGSVNLDKASLSQVTISTNGAASETASYIICNKSTALAVSLADGTTDGEMKVFTNRNTGIATITPANFAQGTSFALDQYDAATLIWDGTAWYITGHYGATVS